MAAMRAATLQPAVDRLMRDVSGAIFAILCSLVAGNLFGAPLMCQAAADRCVQLGIVQLPIDRTLAAATLRVTLSSVGRVPRAVAGQFSRDRTRRPLQRVGNFRLRTAGIMHTINRLTFLNAKMTVRHHGNSGRMRSAFTTSLSNRPVMPIQKTHENPWSHFRTSPNPEQQHYSTRPCTSDGNAPV